MEKSTLSFVGTCSSGVITTHGFADECVAVAVLSGDFEFDILTQKLNYENPQETAKNVLPKLKDFDLCIVLSSNNLKECLN